MDLSPNKRFRACKPTRQKKPRRAPRKIPNQDKTTIDKNIAKMRSIADQHRTQFLPSKQRMQLPGGLFLNGRVCDPVHKHGITEESKNHCGFNNEILVDEQSARLSGDLQGLLKINSTRSSIGRGDGSSIVRGDGSFLRKLMERNLEQEKQLCIEEGKKICTPLQNNSNNPEKSPDKSVPIHVHDDLRQILHKEERVLEKGISKNEENIRELGSSNIENIKNLIKEHHGDRSVWDLKIWDTENQKDEETEKSFEENSASNTKVRKPKLNKTIDIMKSLEKDRLQNKTIDIMKSLEKERLQSKSLVNGWISSQNFDDTMLTRNMNISVINKSNKIMKYADLEEMSLGKQRLQSMDSGNKYNIIGNETKNDASKVDFYTGYDSSFSKNMDIQLQNKYPSTKMEQEDCFSKSWQNKYPSAKLEQEGCFSNSYKAVEKEDIYHLYNKKVSDRLTGITVHSNNQENFNFNTSGNLMCNQRETVATKMTGIDVPNHSNNQEYFNFNNSDIFMGNQRETVATRITGPNHSKNQGVFKFNNSENFVCNQRGNDATNLFEEPFSMNTFDSYTGHKDINGAYQDVSKDFFGQHYQPGLESSVQGSYVKSEDPFMSGLYGYNSNLRSHDYNEDFANFPITNNNRMGLLSSNHNSEGQDGFNYFPNSDTHSMNSVRDAYSVPNFMF